MYSKKVLQHNYQGKISFIGAQPQKIKTVKNAKKNMGKGKKKSSNQKSDPAQTLEANGPLDKTKVTAE